MLRPAESAVRRLIVTFATITNLKAPPPGRSRPPPRGLGRTPRGERQRLPFPLFDPRQEFFRKRRARAPRIRSLAPGAVHGPRSTGVRDTSDGMETSDTLLRRLAALRDALENLPRQARRLVRALARREKSPRLRFRMPVRMGPPPGHRKKPRLEIDTVLHDCHWLARNAVAPNTS